MLCFISADMKTLYSSYIHFISFRAGFGLDIRQYNSLSCFIGQTCVLYFTFLIPVIYNFKFDRYTPSNLMFIIYSLFMGRLEMHQQYWQQQLIESYYTASIMNEFCIQSIIHSQTICNLNANDEFFLYIHVIASVLWFPKLCLH